MRSALCAALVASLTLALTAAAGGAASLPQIGRYKGQTGDGHVFQFNVEASYKANSSEDPHFGWSTALPTALRARSPAVLRQRVQDPRVTARRLLPHEPEERGPGQPGAAAPDGQVHVDDPGDRAASASA